MLVINKQTFLKSVAFILISGEVTSMNLINSNYEVKFKDIDMNNNLSIDCTIALTKKFVPCGSKITYVDVVNTNNKLIKTLNSDFCYTLMVRSTTTERILNTQAYVIVTKNALQFESTVRTLSNDSSWNPRAKFLVNINNFVNDETDDIFKVLLALHVLDVLLIVASKMDGEAIVYSYDPFNNHQCGKTVNNSIITQYCNSVDPIDVDMKTREQKYQNCSVTIAAKEDILNFIFPTNEEFSYLGEEAARGIEQRIFLNIELREHIKIKYILLGPEVDYGIVLPNHTATGGLLYLQNNTADIVAGGYFLLNNRAEMFDFVWGYQYANMYLFTPADGEQKWKKVYQEFSATTWILIIISFCFITIIIGTVRNYLLGKEDKNLLILKIWGYLYGHPDLGLFQVKKMRIIIITWVWFTYFITSFYNTAYFSLLTGKTVVKQKAYTKELQDLQLKPCLTGNLRTFFEYSYNQSLPRDRKENLCKHIEMALDTVAYGTEYYTLQMDYAYFFREYRYIDEEGNRKLNKMKFANDVMFTLYARRGFPFLDKFQRYAQYYLEAGLYQRHLNEINHRNQIFYHRGGVSKFKNSRWDDFRIHFSILLIGYVLSVILFIIEINKGSVYVVS